MLRRLNLQGRTLLVVCLFMVSVFIVVLKIMNPIEIHIFLEGEETVLSQVMHNFTLYDVILLLFAAFTAGLSAAYLLFFDKGLARGDVMFNGKKMNYEKILPTLKEYEAKVFQAVLDSDGIIAQSELSGLTGVSKSNVSRALDHLESRGYVERRRRGMGNIIVLK